MAINLNVNGNTAPLEAAVQAAVTRIKRTPIKITVDDKGATQPLGNMKRGADEFSKSMEAANARIIAFGASMAIINGVSDAFKAMVKNVVEVEKSLADINVVMGLSANNLDKFSSSLFKVAKETGAAFNVAAEAATEYARQGLAVEETLKRTQDALILTRLTGMDSANAVKALTAAMNTYGDQIKDTTQLVSKFAAVDVKFAVSAEDFADAISRTGQAAKSAGVDIDELVGLVTAAQQKTARGGKVIGNSFKTIFTRIGRTDTLNQLENLGIAVRDVEGKTIGAKRILTDLANTFDHLTESQKAQIAQTVGGVFQINVLKAVLSDAAKQNGILANATQISAGATDEAITKNEQLRQTMAAMATETGLALKEMSASVGELMLAPGMEKILNIVKSVAEGTNDMLGGGEASGNSFAKGFLKGVGNIITGPGLVVIVAVFTKLLVKAVQYARESLSSLIGVTSEAQKQKAIQTSLVNLFGQNAALSKEMLRTDISRTEKEKIILGLLKAQVAEANLLNTVAKSSASNLYRQGYGANLAPRKGRAGGHIPNFADPEREQAARGGYAAGTIRSMNMPGEGSVIYNSAEKVKNFKGMSQPAIMPPHSSKAGKNYQQAFGSIHGFDPYAAGGYVPNYARTYNRKSTGNKRTTSNTSDIKKINLNNLFPETSQMGVLLGFGSGDSAGPKEYKQKYSSLSAPAKIALNKKLKPSLVKQLSKKGAYSPLVSATLKTKPVYEVSDGDASQIEQILGKSTLEKKLYKHVGQGFDRFSHEVGVDMFGGKIGKAGTGVLKTHMDGSMLGGILEAAVRGSLSNKKVSDSQAPFDFIGEDAKNVAKFIGDDKLRYIEAKLHKSAAAGSSGKLPMKVLNEFKAYGHIPNFANPLSDAIGREKEAGVPVSKIRIGSHSALMNKSNPIGLGVTNTDDEPNGLKDVFGAANGYVPNYFNPFSFAKDKIVQTNFAKQMTLGASNLEDFNKKLKKHKQEQQKHSTAVSRIEKQLQRNLLSQKELDRLNKQLATAKKHEAAASKKVASTTRGAGFGGVLGRSSARMGGAFSGNSGMMMMMGAPMAAGFLQQGGTGAQGGNQGMYAAGGALSGAASGAMMASMVAPMFGPAAPLVIAMGGLVGGFKGFMGAQEENTKALKEKREQEIKAQTQSTSNAVSQIIQGSELSKTLSSAGITEQSIATLGLKKDDTILQGLKKSKVGHSASQQLVDVMKQYEAGKVETVSPEKLNRVVDSILKNAKIGKEQFESTKTALGATFAPQPQNDMRRYKDITSRKEALEFLSKRAEYNTWRGEGIFGSEKAKARLNPIGTAALYTKGAQEYMGGTGDPDFNAIKAKQRSELASSGQARSELIDYLMENEKKTSFAYDFGEEKGGTGYLDKTQYANLLKGKEVNVGGKIGPQTLEEAAIKTALTKESERIKSEHENAQAKQLDALILQLDLQKVQVAAQQAAAMNQLKIKDKYSKIADDLSFEQKIMGSFATDLQKSQNKYLTSMNKANEALVLSEAKADDALRSDIQAKLKTGQYSDIELELKKKLFGESAGEKTDQDVTNAMASKSGKELVAILEKIKDKNTKNESIQKLINKLIDSSIVKQKNALEIANKIFTNKEDQAKKEKVINDILAKRKQYIDDINRGVKKYSDDLKTDQTVEDFEDKLAKSQRLTAFGPGYKSGRERENFQMREKEIDLEKKLNKIRGTRSADILKLDSQKAIAEKDNADMLKLGAQLDPFSMEYIGGSGKDLSNETAQYETLKKSAEERQKVIDDHEDSVQRIKDTTETQITVEQKLLEEEKKRLKLKREYETGPGAMRNGAREAQKRIVEQAETMELRLGGELTNQFRNGLVDGMQAAINKADDLSDVMNNIAMNFLGAIQQAYLGKAADAIVGALPFSSGGGVRKYSKGGGVPAMVTNGEYVMGRDAVKKYGGGFMHRLNAGGKLPGYSTGGKPDEPQPGSALAANFGGGEGYNTGRRYQSQAMSGFFYSGQAGNVGLQEDTQYTKGIIQERMRKEAEKKAKKRALMQMIVGTALSVGIGSMVSGALSGGPLTEGAEAAGYTSATPKGARMAVNSSGDYVSLLPGAKSSGYSNVLPTRSGMFGGFKNMFSGSSDSNLGQSAADPYLTNFFKGDNNRYFGGNIGKYANGGHIAGKSGIDQIPAMLSEGEYVIRASSARQLGKPMLDRINAGKFNDGGAVTPLTENSETGTSGGNTNNINVTVNMQRGKGKSEEKDSSSSGGTNPKDASAEEERTNNLAEKVKEQVITVIMEEQRPGGLLSD